METMTQKNQKGEAAREWRTLPIGEVISPTRPRVSPTEKPTLPFIGMEHVEAHTMKLLGTVPAATMKSSSVHFQPGDVLYGRLRPYLNKVYRPDFEGLCSAEFIVFPTTPDIDTKYLQYFLNSYDFVSFATHLNEGDRPRVDFKQIAPYPFPLAPLPEQRRIVSAIETQLGRLDAAVARLHAAKAQLKRYKQAVLKAAVEGRLTNTDLAEGELPDTWTTERLADIVIEGPSNGYSPKPSKNQDGTKSLKLSATTTGEMLLNDNTIKYIPEVIPPNSKYWLRKGDVLLQRANSLEYLGVAAMYEGPANEYIYPDLMMRVRLANEQLARYFVYYLNTTTARQYFIKRATGTAGNMPKINGETVRELLVPVPPPEELARLLATLDEVLDQTREMETTLDAQLEQSTRLRQAVLKRAFEGRLV